MATLGRYSFPLLARGLSPAGGTFSGMDESEQVPEVVERLDPGMSGRWRVSTRRSVHVWDLDEGTYARLPGPLSDSFDGDGVAARIYTVRVWPEVGGRFWVYVDDAQDNSMTQWRISSTVRSIELEAPDADPSS